MYSGAVLRKLQKKNRIEVTEFKSKFFERFQSNLPKRCISGTLTSFLPFFFTFLKNVPIISTLPVIFVFYVILCSSNFLCNLHLNDVLEVLLMVGLKFLTNF